MAADRLLLHLLSVLVVHSLQRFAFGAGLMQEMLAFVEPVWTGVPLLCCCHSLVILVHLGLQIVCGPALCSENHCWRSWGAES